MTIDRRSLLAAAVTFSAIPGLGAGTPEERSMAAHHRLAAIEGLKMQGAETVSMLLYPGFTALDLVGPHYFFGSLMGARVDLVTPGVDLTPVRSDLGLAIAPTVTLAEAPAAPTILFVPGGSAGTVAAMRDDAIRAYIATRGAAAAYVTSVCTGSMLLAQAGLLVGKRATSHWVVRDLLGKFGAVAVNERVVVDGRLITGAGVTAGLDFALTVVAELRGRPYAEALMLQGEYAPQPPFAGGTVESTDPAIAGAMRDMFAPVTAAVSALAPVG